MMTKSILKKVQWSVEEIKCLVVIWASMKFQKKLKGSTCKTTLYMNKQTSWKGPDIKEH